jgi:hypothetical protein
MGSRKPKTQRTETLPLSNGMKPAEALEALEALAKQLDIEVRYEKGDFKGGVCRVRDQELILIQKDEPITKKIKLLAKELGERDLETIYVLPALREIIESEMTLDD